MDPNGAGVSHLRWVQQNEAAISSYFLVFLSDSCMRFCYYFTQEICLPGRFFVVSGTCQTDRNTFAHHEFCELRIRKESYDRCAVITNSHLSITAAIVLFSKLLPQSGCQGLRQREADVCRMALTCGSFSKWAFPPAFNCATDQTSVGEPVWIRAESEGPQRQI